ncbi:hypothetical protein P3T18_003161 [Paraburkholderia sp. GAS199]
MAAEYGTRRHERATDFRVDLRRLELGEGPHADRAAHAVDQNVDAAEGARREGHRRRGAVVRFEVGNEARGVRATRFRRDFRDEIGAIDEQYLAALGGCAQRNRATDTLRGAGHDHDLAGESLRSHAALGTTLGVNFS